MQKELKLPTKMETTVSLIKLLKNFSNSIHILKFYGSGNECIYLMLFLCKATNESYEKHQKGFLSQLSANKMLFVYKEQFDKRIGEYLLKNHRYTKFNFKISLVGADSYKWFTSFITRVKYLKLLSLSAPGHYDDEYLNITEPPTNIIEGRSICGEYEGYVNLLKTFKTLKMNYEGLVNQHLFNDSGHGYPSQSSIEHLFIADSLKEFNLAIVGNILNLDFKSVCALKNMSLNSSPKLLSLTCQSMMYILDNEGFIPVSSLKIVELNIIGCSDEALASIIMNICSFMEYIQKFNPIFDIKLILNFKEFNEETLVDIFTSKFRHKILTVKMNWHMDQDYMENKFEYIFEASNCEIEL